jgi:hypothetical protein
MRYARLLTIVVVAALTLPPSPSLAQQRGASRVPPGGPIIQSGRVLRGQLFFADLVITGIFASPLKCVGPSRGQVTISVRVQNQGNAAAVMPPTLPTLGRYWVGVWDFHIFPAVMAIAAGPPSQLKPADTWLFDVPVIVRPFARPNGIGYDVAAKVDPGFVILESNEDNNDSHHFFNSKLCP